MRRKDLIDWTIEDYMDVYSKMEDEGLDFNDPSDMVKFLNKILRD